MQKNGPLDALPLWGLFIVDARLEAVRSGNISEGIRRSENIQQQLWSQAEAVGELIPIRLWSVYSSSRSTR
jgi:hypothetical protein